MSIYCVSLFTKSATSSVLAAIFFCADKYAYLHWAGLRRDGFEACSEVWDDEWGTDIEYG
jgi:hypothetical protein